MVTEAWNEVIIQTITGSLTTVFRSPEEIKLPSRLNNAVHDEHVTLIKLYHHVVPNNNLDEVQILHWATGVNEMPGSLITDEDITENIISNEEINNEDSSCHDIEEPIRGANIIINWAESNLPIRTKVRVENALSYQDFLT